MHLNYLKSLEFIFKNTLFEIERCSDNCYNVGINYTKVHKSKITLNEVRSVILKD